MIVYDVDRVCNIIYALMFSEEKRLRSEVDNRFHLMRRNDDDLLCIENYKQSIVRLKCFEEIQAKVFETIKRF